MTALHVMLKDEGRLKFNGYISVEDDLGWNDEDFWGQIKDLSVQNIETTDYGIDVNPFVNQVPSEIWQYNEGWDPNVQFAF